MQISRQARLPPDWGLLLNNCGQVKLIGLMVRSNDWASLIDLGRIVSIQQRDTPNNHKTPAARFRFSSAADVGLSECSFRVKANRPLVASWPLRTDRRWDPSCKLRTATEYWKLLGFVRSETKTVWELDRRSRNWTKYRSYRIYIGPIYKLFAATVARAGCFGFAILFAQHGLA